MTEDNLHTKVDLENGSPAFAKPMLPAVFVGQVLFREKINRNAPSEIVEVTVGKVGEK